MSYKNIRENYPYITFGSYRRVWDEGRERLRWLLHRLDTERPTEALCHEWYRLRGCFGTAMAEFEKAWRALPKDRKYYKDCDVGERAPWPEDRAALDDCETAFDKVDRISKEVSLLLLNLEFRLSGTPSLKRLASPKELRDRGKNRKKSYKGARR